VADAKVRLQALLSQADVSRLGATADATIGTPAWTIVEYATGHDIDLIVMGTHGRGGVSHLLMGSVAERVVRTAPCPVLTTRGEFAEPNAATTRDEAAEVPPAMLESSTADRC
jgi:nucleotide-binding universal stress UspA family protein